MARTMKIATTSQQHSSGIDEPLASAQSSASETSFDTDRAQLGPSGGRHDWSTDTVEMPVLVDPETAITMRLVRKQQQ